MELDFSLSISLSLSLSSPRPPFSLLFTKESKGINNTNYLKLNSEIYIKAFFDTWKKSQNVWSYLSSVLSFSINFLCPLMSGYYSYDFSPSVIGEQSIWYLKLNDSVKHNQVIFVPYHPILWEESTLKYKVLLYFFFQDEAALKFL